jgi:hypothetical protein
VQGEQRRQQPVLTPPELLRGRRRVPRRGRGAGSPPGPGIGRGTRRNRHRPMLGSFGDPFRTGSARDSGPGLVRPVRFPGREVRREEPVTTGRIRQRVAVAAAALAASAVSRSCREPPPRRARSPRAPAPGAARRTRPGSCAGRATSTTRCGARTTCTTDSVRWAHPRWTGPDQLGQPCERPTRSASTGAGRCGLRRPPAYLARGQPRHQRGDQQGAAQRPARDDVPGDHRRQAAPAAGDDHDRQQYAPGRDGKTPLGEEIRPTLTTARRRTSPDALGCLLRPAGTPRHLVAVRVRRPSAQSRRPRAVGRGRTPPTGDADAAGNPLPVRRHPRPARAHRLGSVPRDGVSGLRAR